MDVVIYDEAGDRGHSESAHSLLDIMNIFKGKYFDYDLNMGDCKVTIRNNYASIIMTFIGHQAPTFYGLYKSYFKVDVYDDDDYTPPDIDITKYMFHDSHFLYDDNDEIFIDSVISFFTDIENCITLSSKCIICNQEIKGRAIEDSPGLL